MRKTIFSLIGLVALLMLTAARVPTRAPAFLRPGDKVAIIAPASAHPYSIVDSGIKHLTRWGYQPVVGRAVGKRFRSFAGTVKQRREDLLWALRDTSIKAIMCTRGGYGSAQLLCEIPLDEFRRNPKWVIGYSDITALHSAEVCAGVMSIHANMCDPIGRGDSTSRALQYLLMGKMPSYKVPAHEYNVKGRAQGILVGGNMSVLTDLAESPYDCLNRDLISRFDVILFIEDTHENFQHVDRMLHQLKLRGVLNHIKGLIIGHFNDYRKENGWDDMYEMFNLYLKDSKIPVCYGFPTGHIGRRNYPMIEGCPVTLTVADDSVSLDFNMPLRYFKD